MLPVTVTDENAGQTACSYGFTVPRKRHMNLIARLKKELYNGVPTTPNAVLAAILLISWPILAGQMFQDELTGIRFVPGVTLFVIAVTLVSEVGIELLRNALYLFSGELAERVSRVSRKYHAYFSYTTWMLLALFLAILDVQSVAIPEPEVRLNFIALFGASTLAKHYLLRNVSLKRLEWWARLAVIAPVHFVIQVAWVRIGYPYIYRLYEGGATRIGYALCLAWAICVIVQLEICHTAFQRVNHEK